MPSDNDPLEPTPSSYPNVDPNSKNTAYLPGLNTFLQVGECMMVKEPIAIEKSGVGEHALLSTRICRLMSSPRLFETSPGSKYPNGRYIQVQWYIEAKTLCKREKILLEARLTQPPDDRTYIEYPTEVVETKYVQWISVENVSSEAYVFYQQDIDIGDLSFTVAMENSFTVVGLWEDRINRISPCREPQSPYQLTRPNSYTKSKLLFLRSVSYSIMSELSKTSFQQRLVSRKKISCSEGDWEFLRNRLKDRLELILRPNSTCTLIVPRQFGSREAIKTRTTVEVFRAASKSQVDILATVFGKCIQASVRIKPRVEGSLRRRDGKAKFAVKMPLSNDEAHGFFHLPDTPPEEPFKIRSSLPRIDLIFNPLLSEVVISIRYFAGTLREHAVKKVFSKSYSTPAVDSSDDDDDADDDSSELSKSTSTQHEHPLSQDALALLVPEETEFEANGILFLVLCLRRQRLSDNEFIETIVTESQGIVGVPRKRRCHFRANMVRQGTAKFVRIKQPEENCIFVDIPSEEAGTEYSDTTPFRDDCVFWTARDALSLVEFYNGIS